MVGFKGKLIHVFNKNENAIHSSDYFEKLHNRTNVVLMGDSLGDIKMALGVPQPSNVLKIGFLNDKVNIIWQWPFVYYVDIYDKFSHDCYTRYLFWLV